MAFDIKFSDEALFDLAKAKEYYSNLSKELLLKFDNYIIEAVNRLQLNPENFQKRYSNIKIIFTKKFPYSIHYLVENNTIYVQRILHQKQFYK